MASCNMMPCNMKIPLKNISVQNSNKKEKMWIVSYLSKIFNTFYFLFIYFFTY